MQYLTKVISIDKKILIDFYETFFIIILQFMARLLH